MLISAGHYVRSPAHHVTASTNKALALMIIPEQQRELQHREVGPSVQDHTARERSLLRLGFALVIAGHPGEQGYYVGGTLEVYRARSRS